MQAKKCDVCGALYEEECTPDIRINWYRHPYGDNWIDLCPNCQKKLEAFVKGDKKDEKTQRISVYPCLECCPQSEWASCCGCEKEKQWQEKHKEPNRQS